MAFWPNDNCTTPDPTDHQESKAKEMSTHTFIPSFDNFPYTNLSLEGRASDKQSLGDLEGGDRS
jgi:hypothetical protein